MVCSRGNKVTENKALEGDTGLEFSQASGKRHAFAEDPLVDALWVSVVALTAELSVTRTRLDTLERLLAADGTLSRERIEAYEPEDAVSSERSRWQQDMLARVFRRFAQGFR